MILSILSRIRNCDLFEISLVSNWGVGRMATSGEIVASGVAGSHSGGIHAGASRVGVGVGGGVLVCVEVGMEVGVAVAGTINCVA
jgi:hypothetical protein